MSFIKPNEHHFLYLSLSKLQKYKIRSCSNSKSENISLGCHRLVYLRRAKELLISEKEAPAKAQRIRGTKRHGQRERQIESFPSRSK